MERRLHTVGVLEHAIGARCGSGLRCKDAVESREYEGRGQAYAEVLQLFSVDGGSGGGLLFPLLLNFPSRVLRGFGGLVRRDAVPDIRSVAMHSVGQSFLHLEGAGG